MAHKHSIYGTDPHFSIDPFTRKLTDQSTTKTALMQGDHNSERFTFEIPRMVDGHDMAECTRVEIHYLNVSSNASESNADVYEVSDLGTSPADDQTVVFSWLVSGNATKFAGTLAFRIRFICTTHGIVEYVWHSGLYEGITVGRGMTNTAAVIERFTDILEEWKDSIYADAIARAEGAINDAIEEAKANGSFKGEPGYTPQRGVDYWTPADIAEVRGYLESAILGGEW